MELADRDHGADWRRVRRPVVHMSVIGTLVAGVKEEMIFNCISSLLETTKDAPFDVRVTAIDNSPQPGLAFRLQSRFPSIQVIDNQVRKGYAANHNMAVSSSDADYWLMCNDDLVFLPGALERAVSFLEDHRHGIVGVVAFQLLNPDGTVQESTFSFPTVPRMLLASSGLRELIPFSGWTYAVAKLLHRGDGRSRFWAHDRQVPIETFMGAAMLVRAVAARDVGPMDEVALLGGEEVEWHRRFWKRGWKIMFLPDARIIHYGSQTLRVMPALEAEYLKGTLNYFSKHRRRPVVVAFCVLALPLVFLRAVGAMLLGKRDAVKARWACLRVLRRGLLGAPLERAIGAARTAGAPR